MGALGIDPLEFLIGTQPLKLIWNPIMTAPFIRSNEFTVRTPSYNIQDSVIARIDIWSERKIGRVREYSEKKTKEKKK